MRAARRLLDNDAERVARWVAKKIPHYTLEEPYEALGWTDRAGNLLAGVVYERYIVGRDVCMHVAAVPGRRWLNREFLGEAFRYPFLYLGVRRVTGLVPASNEAAQRFDEHLGFKYEGCLRAHLPKDEDLLIYGMLREECSWLEVGLNGRKATSFSITARS